MVKRGERGDEVPFCCLPVPPPSHHLTPTPNKHSPSLFSLTVVKEGSGALLREGLAVVLEAADDSGRALGREEGEGGERREGERVV